MPRRETSICDGEFAVVFRGKLRAGEIPEKQPATVIGIVKGLPKPVFEGSRLAATAVADTGLPTLGHLIEVIEAVKGNRTRGHAEKHLTQALQVFLLDNFSIIAVQSGRSGHIDLGMGSAARILKKACEDFVGMVPTSVINKTRRSLSAPQRHSFGMLTAYIEHIASAEVMS